MGVKQFDVSLAERFNIAEGVPQLDEDARIPLSLFADSAASNGDIIQKKLGNYTPRSPAQLWTDLYGSTDFYKNAGLWFTPSGGIGGASAAHTGTLSETVLRTIAIPAAAPGATGIIKVRSLWTIVTSGNNKTLRHRFGASGAGIGGTSYFNNNFTTQIGVEIVSVICNKTASSQIAKNNAISTDGGFSGATANQTSSINTANASEVVISAVLANVADSVTLEHFHVEVMYGA